MSVVLLRVSARLLISHHYPPYPSLGRGHAIKVKGLGCKSRFEVA